MAALLMVAGFSIGMFSVSVCETKFKALILALALDAAFIYGLVLLGGIR